ncbi:hypothetical protein [Catenulispora rubra]|uniref:hypothetical protein n=1 Tax=Catenulispora rubra TaxID=280293 RepID=UPI001891F5BE|nr:hypothetical protein [Catenulispora rubra]
MPVAWPGLRPPGSPDRRRADPASAATAAGNTGLEVTGSRPVGGAHLLDEL